MYQEKIARIFPRRTKATPTDKFAFTQPPGIFEYNMDVNEIHISVTFTWDLKKAEYLEKQWRNIANTKIGGPALNEQGKEFIPGRYLKNGYVITSRGCPNKCWFCSVWKREPKLIELPIVDGWNILDDNFLACSEKHVIAVFNMLKKQKNPIEFTGGLEANRLLPKHIDLLLSINLKQIFFAYDTKDDYEPLCTAAKMLKQAGILRQTSHKVRAFVLIGYKDDTFEMAEDRLKQVVSLGIMPMAMLYRGIDGKTQQKWRQLQREWANPIIVGKKMYVSTK